VVNDLLDLRGTPIPKHQGRFSVITYADILRSLDSVNEDRGQKDRITYDCLWVHARRHHDVAAVGAYLSAHMVEMFVKALGSSKVPTKKTQRERH
jgi:hypothetical protein